MDTKQRILIIKALKQNHRSRISDILMNRTVNWDVSSSSDQEPLNDGVESKNVTFKHPLLTLPEEFKDGSSDRSSLRSYGKESRRSRSPRSDTSSLCRKLNRQSNHRQLLRSKVTPASVRRQTRYADRKISWLNDINSDSFQSPRKTRLLPQIQVNNQGIAELPREKNKKRLRFCVTMSPEAQFAMFQCYEDKLASSNEKSDLIFQGRELIFPLRIDDGTCSTSYKQKPDFFDVGGSRNGIGALRKSCIHISRQTVIDRDDYTETNEKSLRDHWSYTKKKF